MREKSSGGQIIIIIDRLGMYVPQSIFQSRVQSNMKATILDRPVHAPGESTMNHSNVQCQPLSLFLAGSVGCASGKCVFPFNLLSRLVQLMSSLLYLMYLKLSYTGIRVIYPKATQKWKMYIRTKM